MLEPVSDEEIAGIIEDGADYIEKWGWHQGDLYNWNAVHSYQGRPPACIQGGIMVGNKMKNCMNNRAPMAIIMARFHRAVPEVGIGVTTWNDRVCESKQQALDMMRLAAKRLRIGEHGG